MGGQCTEVLDKRRRLYPEVALNYVVPFDGVRIAIYLTRRVGVGVGGWVLVAQTLEGPVSASSKPISAAKDLKDSVEVFKSIVGRL